MFFVSSNLVIYVYIYLSREQEYGLKSFAYRHQKRIGGFAFTFALVWLSVNLQDVSIWGRSANYAI